MNDEECTSLPEPLQLTIGITNRHIDIVVHNHPALYGIIVYTLAAGSVYNAMRFLEVDVSFCFQI